VPGKDTGQCDTFGPVGQWRQVPERGLGHERLLVTLPVQLEEVDHLGHDPAASEERNEVDPRAWLADVLAPLLDDLVKLLPSIDSIAAGHSRAVERSSPGGARPRHLDRCRKSERRRDDPIHGRDVGRDPTDL
jgi:hypothetical protein